MSRTEWFRDHRIWAALSELGPALDGAAEKVGHEAASLEALGRFKAVLGFTGKRLASADPFLVRNDLLDTLAARIEEARASAQAFVTDGSTEQVKQLDVAVVAILKLLPQFIVPFTPSDFIAVKETAEAYRIGAERLAREAIEQTEKVRVAADASRARLEELSDVSTKERERMLAMAGEFQSQFAEAQEARQREHSLSQAERDQRVQEATAQLAAAIAEQQAAAELRGRDAAQAHQEQLDAHARDHTVAQEEHRKRLEELEAAAKVTIEAKAVALTTMLSDAEAAQRAQLAALKTEFSGGASQIRDEILRRKDEIEALAGVIANTGMTSGYQQVANEAKLLSRIWQGVTVASMLGFIWLAYQVFLPSIGNDFSWAAFAGRVFVALSVGVLAAYAGAQADRQQKSERHNRRLALELQALGPFIATLPKEQQNEFLLKIGERSFGRGDGAADEKSPTSAADIATSKDLRGFLTDLVRAARGS